jgi:hypothetical protein
MRNSLIPATLININNLKTILGILSDNFKEKEPNDILSTNTTLEKILNTNIEKIPNEIKTLMSNEVDKLISSVNNIIEKTQTTAKNKSRLIKRHSEIEIKNKNRLIKKTH